MSKVWLGLGKVVIGLAVCVLVTTALKVALTLTVAKAAQVREAVLTALPKRGSESARVTTLEGSIMRASRAHRIDPIILQIISEKESSGGDSRSLYRFEPALFAKLRASKTYRALSDSEVRMLASSHGAFHILGVTAEQECQLHFSRLYDAESSAMCAARIVSRISSGLKDKSAAHRLRETFRQYNGRGRMAEQYASDAMIRLATILYQRTNG